MKRRLMMKKSFIVLLLVSGVCGFAYADMTDGVLVRYDFDGDLADSSSNGRDGMAVGNPVVSDGFLTLDAESSVDIPLGGANPFDGSGDYTAAVRFRTTETAGILLSSSRDESSDNHSMAIYVYNINNPSGGEVSYDSFCVGEARADAPDGTDVFDGEWHTAVVTYDSANELILVYLDLVQGAGEGHFNPAIPDVQEDTVRIGGSLNGHPGGWIGLNGYIGDIDYVAVYNRILSPEEMELLSQGLVAKEKAKKPNPRDGATDVPRDVVLNWTPGEYASAFNGHIVYLNESFANVNDGIGGITQTADSYAPAQRLDFGQTYFWRIDEVNSAPDSTVFAGDVWSFTIESIAYPVSSEAVTATASSNAPGQGPENTANASGLDANDLHSVLGTDMWLTALGDPGPAWIQYEFDKVLKLHEMWVWNQNTLMEPAIGFGIKNAAVEYSADGTNWTTLGTTHEFARGTAAPGYAPNTTIDFEGAAAKYVKLTPNSNWGGLLDQYGLSEVRFLSVPVSAGEPDPATGATGVDVNVVLSWKAGREAVEHNVYLSTDEQAVIDGTAPVNTVTETGFIPSLLDVGTTYYWRVDEVNDAETTTTWQGEIWNFSTQGSLVVDNFESYNDIPFGEEGSNLVYETWIDGYANPSANGSTMGHTVPFEPSMENSTAYDGRQSAPLYYDNTTASMSEVTANTSDLAIGGDWTVGSPQTLVLWVYGATDNVAQQMYVKVGSAKELYGGDVTDPSWSQWDIDLAGLGINLSNVTQLSIGLERIGAAGGSGMVLIDAIRLY